MHSLHKMEDYDRVVEKLATVTDELTASKRREELLTQTLVEYKAVMKNLSEALNTCITVDIGDSKEQMFNIALVDSARTIFDSMRTSAV